MISTTKEQAIVGVFASHIDAETAVKSLQSAGIDMKKLSIIGKNFQAEEHAVGFYTSGDRMLFWGGKGVFWGSLWGMLFGGALFFIPGIGPLVAMGPIVGWLAGSIEGALLGGAVGVVSAALASIGVPQNQTVKYETEVKAGKFLVIAHGAPSEIELARGVLQRERTLVQAS